MKEPVAMAYVNLYGVLGCIPQLCRLDEDCRHILSGLKKPVALCFEVKGGPCRTFRFTREGCEVAEGDAGSNAKMRFSSPEKFNAFIDGGAPGMPVKHPVRTIVFLLKVFAKLAERLTYYLRPTPEQLSDRAFFEKNTLLTLYTVAGAISALANTDSVSRISAGNTPDGEISVGIRDTVSVTILVKDHVFATVDRVSAAPRAVMEFADIDLANGLFRGEVSTINELCKGRIRLAGMISMIDNVNRILDRVSVYLA